MAKGDQASVTADLRGARLEAMISMLRQFRSTAVVEFGPNSALSDLLSDEMIGWFASYGTEQGGRTANILGYLDAGIKKESDLLDLNRRLKENLAQTAAERGNLERVVVDLTEESRRQIEALQEQISMLREAAVALYREITILHSRANGLKSAVATAWFAGESIKPDQLRALVGPSPDELEALIREHVSVVSMDWGAIPERPPIAAPAKEVPAKIVGRVVVGEAHINVRIPMRSEPCPPDCATKLGHSHAFDGDGDAG